jgi:hypothetical protein
MRSAGIVADHSADGAAIVRGRVRGEGELMALGTVAKRIKDNSRLNDCEFMAGVDFDNPIHVLRKIEDHRNIATLAGKACAGAAGQNRRLEFLAGSHRGEHIVGIAGNDQADGDLPVIGSVRRIKGAAASIEAHFAAHCAP